MWYIAALLWYIVGVGGSLAIFCRMRNQWRDAFLSERPIEPLDVAMILLMGVCGPISLLMGLAIFFHKNPDDD